MEKVSVVDKEALMAEISPEEVKAAVDAMHPDKSPRPDDVNLAFF